MRNVKFRVWDEESRTMYEDYKAIVTFSGEVDEVYVRKGRSVEELIDYKIMQYIGLKDLNGVEIYEGDILLSEERCYPSHNPYLDYSEEQLKEFCKYDEKEDDYYEEYEMYMKVQYNTEKAAFELKDIHADDIYNFSDDFESTEVKIIGNIHENKELLEG